MRHIPIWVEGHWACMNCSWTGSTDEEAHAHYHTGMERMLDELGVAD